MLTDLESDQEYTMSEYDLLPGVQLPLEKYFTT